jgi:hypothetical protein
MRISPKPLKWLVGRGGFEPPTNGLKVVFFPYASENDSS